MTRAVRTDRNTTVMPVTTLYNCVEQKRHNRPNPEVDGL